MSHWRGHFADAHWYDQHWLQPEEVEHARSGFEQTMHELFSLAAALPAAALDFSGPLTLDPFEPHAAALFQLNNLDGFETAARDLFSRGLSTQAIETKARTLFSLSLGDGSNLEAVAAALFDQNGRNTDMFAETVTYDTGTTQAQIKAIFVPAPPVEEDDGAGLKVWREAKLLISYSALDGVASPVPYKDKVQVRGTWWTVYPYKDYDGGHWLLPLRRRERLDAHAAPMQERQT